ncbi:winged helix DNA-binding domain-containing protein [uncultured Friedmanniella sp.]|uniref:winged helix DNA-binding domain-containing protein n=1 Tax=uncultured Friedmanniella sp. TaxID=335381 RepID=UPI0035CA7C8D
MSRVSLDELRERTLWRQFPDLPGRDGEAVLALVDRLGPIQSQVPRAPFLTASSRLPGVRYTDVRDLFASFVVLKTSSLRGTVHTSGRRLFPWLDAVARPGRAGPLRTQLDLAGVSAADVVAEIEAYADDAWRSRADIVTHLRDWLAEHESAASAAALTGTFRENLIWGHSGLLRRPPDDRWEKRTDVYHRRARSVVPELGTTTVAEALAHLVRVYLGALGPATRQDLAYFFGTGLTVADAAVTSLGDEVVRLTGPEGETFLDLAEPPPAHPRALGVRLLPEFDALVVGYHQRNRTRFVTADGLGELWARANGQFAPVVLLDDRLVAIWRTVGTSRRTIIEVTPLPGHHPPPEDLLGSAALAVAAALGLPEVEVRLEV